VTATAQWRIIQVPAESTLLTDVIALGDSQRHTLGHLPRAVFGLRAEEGTLLAAVDDDNTVHGYGLYEVARNRVRLVHLCINPQTRRHGLAARLVDAISDAHADLAGIRVTCRADYDAAAVWPRLGFTLMTERPGRGKERKTLQVWWRSHGLPDLFSTVTDDDDALLVAIDHNVFIDLSIDPNRVGAEESQPLAADWLIGQIRLALTSETRNEIGGLTSRTERERQRAATTTYPMLDATPADLQTKRQSLQQALQPGTVSSSDLSHVVHASAGGATVFVTRDADLITAVADAARSVLGLTVLRPSDLLLHLDELLHADRYRPAALRGTGFSVQDVPAGTQERYAELLSTDTGERRGEFKTRLRALFSDRELTRQQVLDPEGDIVVAWASRQLDHALHVSFLRARQTALAPTVLRLLLFDLRRTAVSAGADRVLVTDPHLSPAVITALAEDGFLRDGGSWQAHVLDVRSAAAAVAALPAEHPLRPDLSSAALGPGRVATLERQLWPAKLLDLTLANYVIAIQPRWAHELFSLTDTLFERASMLGLSREHVYYRAPGGNPQFPARILWYASGRGRDRIGAVVACSQLVDVTVGHPRGLFRRYQHLGVYQQRDVQAAGRDDRASALRFVDTERFAFPVPLARLRALATDRPIGPLLSPTVISSHAYAAVYREGTGRAGH
jgi:GNAT superfamily N-acetyltransferase